MTGSSTFLSTWMLSALLLLFIAIQQSSLQPTRMPTCERLHEFNRIVDELGKGVEHCRKNCSSGPIIHRGCRCINTTVSKGCSHPEYFIHGVKSLDSHLNLTITGDLIRKLEAMNRTCRAHITSLFLECDRHRVITPVTLFKQLETLKQRLNSK